MKLVEREGNQFISEEQRKKEFKQGLSLIVKSLGYENIEMSQSELFCLEDDVKELANNIIEVWFDLDWYSKEGKPQEVKENIEEFLFLELDEFFNVTLQDNKNLIGQIFAPLLDDNNEILEEVTNDFLDELKELGHINSQTDDLEEIKARRKRSFLEIQERSLIKAKEKIEAKSWGESKKKLVSTLIETSIKEMTRRYLNELKKVKPTDEK